MLADYILTKYRNNEDPMMIWDEVFVVSDIVSVSDKRLSFLTTGMREDLMEYIEYRYKNNDNLFSNFDKWEDNQFVEDNKIYEYLYNVLEVFEREDSN